ncbi:MAG: hypothetical protein A2Z16_01105 [Chloroflexi bacterium RBG_16_54_18]|nr:MAG: hypothetical protein A2Z16_01105 [Chloroflexi bacterium RBG_16_54_18]
MGFERNRLRAICFDVDGTLRDTDDQLVMRLARLISPLASLTRTRQPKEIARRIVMAIENPGNSLLTLGDRLGIDGLLNRSGDWIYHSASAGQPAPAPMIDGVYEMLKHLQLEFSLAIVSSRGQKVTMDFLNQHGLQPFFKFVATSQTCRHTKPWPDPIYRAAQEMGVPVQACLMVGDTTIDIRAGKACGAQTAGVLCGFGEEQELREAGADLILTYTTDLLAVLNS